MLRLDAPSKQIAPNQHTIVTRAAQEAGPLPTLQSVAPRLPTPAANGAAQRTAIADSLKGAVKEHGDFTAAGKAAAIAAHLPPELLTRQGVENIQRALKEDPKGVRDLLHHKKGQCGNVEGRALNRALLVARLARGDSLEEVKADKKSYIDATPAQRLAYMNEIRASIKPDRQSQVQPYTAEVADATEFHDPAYHGDSASPLTFTLAKGNTDAARSIVETVFETDNPEQFDPDRVASTHTTLGATGSKFLFTNSLGPCQPLVVFWKSPDDGEQRATIFHFDSALKKDDIALLLNAIDPNMTVDSLNYITRDHNDSEKKAAKRDKLKTELDDLAESLSVPLNITRSQVEQTMAVAVDVQQCKIIAMDEVSELPTPWPDREFKIF